MGFMPGPFELIIVGLMLLVPIGIGYALYRIIKAAVRDGNRESRDESKRE